MVHDTLHLIEQMIMIQGGVAMPLNSTWHKQGGLKSTGILVPIPPWKVLVRVGGFESKGDKVSFRLQGIV